MFKARSPEEAIRKAGTEAKEYVKGMGYTNAYGERVRQRYLGACDAFELFDELDAGAEVFSSNRLVPGTVADQTVVKQLIGAKETKKHAERRWRFLDAEITREFMGDHLREK
jgi:hypothetical protein